MEQLMNPEGNYNNYRLEMAKLQPPSMPYLGTHLKDLTFIEDGNPDTIENLINFRKRDHLVDTIMLLQQCQQTPYSNLEIVEPFYTFLKELPALEDKELFALSNFLERKK